MIQDSEKIGKIPEPGKNHQLKIILGQGGEATPKQPDQPLGTPLI